MKVKALEIFDKHGNKHFAFCTGYSCGYVNTHKDIGSGVASQSGLNIEIYSFGRRHGVFAEATSCLEVTDNVSEKDLEEMNTYLKKTYDKVF